MIGMIAKNFTRRNLAITFLLLVVLRAGSYIPTPGVDVETTIGAVLLSMADMFR